MKDEPDSAQNGLSTLIYDIETSPMVGATWNVYETDLLNIYQYGQVLSVAWSWVGRQGVYVMAQPDFDGYKPGKVNDKEIVKFIHELFNKADCIVAHNGDNYDVRYCNARFMYYQLDPPTPYVTYDTKKAAKRIGRFPTNKLNDIGKYLGLGQKERTGGYDLWEDCMNGDMRAWARMKKYNKQDVVLDKKVMERLLIWDKMSPNANVYYEEHMGCTNISCPSRTQGHPQRIQRRGRRMKKTCWSWAYQCQECGKWSEGQPHPIKPILR